MQSEGLVDVVFPDDALGVVLLEPSFPDVGQHDIQHFMASSDNAIYSVSVLRNAGNLSLYMSLSTFGSIMISSCVLVAF